MSRRSSNRTSSIVGSPCRLAVPSGERVVVTSEFFLPCRLTVIERRLAAAARLRCECQTQQRVFLLISRERTLPPLRGSLAGSFQFISLKSQRSERSEAASAISQGA